MISQSFSSFDQTGRAATERFHGKCDPDELLSYFDASASDSWDDQRPVEEADEE